MSRDSVSVRTCSTASLGLTQQQQSQSEHNSQNVSVHKAEPEMLGSALRFQC